MWHDLDIWKLLAGLGIFMFGMFLLEEAIRQIAGKAFKSFIRTTTTGKLRSIFSGIVSTAVLQSSSAVSLMTLAFAGAGIMTMQNAVGVILGTNIGTTITGWIVATVGFKINIEGISLPLIAIGGLGLIFLANSPRYSGFSKLFVGLGFLFMGLDYMKSSVEVFTNEFDLATLPSYGKWFYFLIGFVLTALMQSSSATIAIILTALHSGIISFPEGAAMVIGANVGTTITILLGSIGGVQIKKQVALSHLIFNLSTAIVAILFLPFFQKVIFVIEPDSTNHVMGIALFHTLFNVLGVIIFFPFINMLVRLLQRMFPEKTTPVTKYINNVSQDMPEAAVEALYRELRHLFRETIALGATLLGLVKAGAMGKVDAELFDLWKEHEEQAAEEQFVHTRALQDIITLYASNIRQGELEADDHARMHRLMHASMTLNQVVKTLWGMRNDLDDLDGEDQVADLFRALRHRNRHYWEGLLQILKEDKTAGKLMLDEMSSGMEAEHEGFIKSVTGQLSQQTIKEKQASTLLVVNGLLTQSNRQLFTSLDEMLFKEPVSAVETVVV